jgi:superfamily II DNA helicase RecQ
MEDQVTKLKQRGFAVARIHSSRDRAASREACLDYLNGKLQFLFIAPERLRVAGFAEMLAKRKPSLIAIDEAHCISQWAMISGRTTACSAVTCLYCDRLP